MDQMLGQMQLEIKEPNFPIQQECKQHGKIKLFYGNFGDQDWKSKFITCSLEYYDNTKIIKYIRDGEIIKIENIDCFEQSLVFSYHNFQQLRDLKWEGSYHQNVKVGKWNAFWKGENLNNGGFYNSVGKKVGRWIEIFENYWDLAEITFEGEYYEGQRIGQWNTIQGGGLFNQQGQRVGKWVELYSYFSNESKVFYIGQYKNGTKKGFWSIMNDDQAIGGGLYDEKGIKLGIWTELLQQYKKFQIIQIGEYYKENKVGKWQIFLNNQIIGGGIFDINGTKQGKWIELYEKFHLYCKVMLVGEYQNGQKIGKWDYIYENRIISGGIFLHNGLKNGSWRELNNKFHSFCPQINEGLYQNGKKIQQWNIISYDSDQILGGGSYDLYGYKNGKWIILHKNYYVGLYSTNRIFQIGQYKQGRKYDHWDIVVNENEKIGGGSYDQNGIKVGFWVELHQNYWDYCNVIQYGNYQNGQKLGKWQIKYKKSILSEFEIQDQGTYDENYQKSNQWIELDENFSNQCEIINQGNYRNGIKVGKWVLKHKNNDITIKRAGGIYDQDGIKQGRWIELSKYFRSYFSILYFGFYLDGKKLNKWQMIYQNITFGGGQHQNNSLKNGKWIEIQECLGNQTQKIQAGNYRNGKKDGLWEIMNEKKLMQLFDAQKEQLSGFQFYIKNEISQILKINNRFDSDKNFNTQFVQIKRNQKNNKCN